jgi:hypothetical protein
MTSSLENLKQTGVLEEEPPDRREFGRLAERGRLSLGDALNETVSREGRFNAAYVAAHALCLAALRYHGYRPRNKRYVVFQALPQTLGLGPEVWRVLAGAHEMRNLAEYEGHLDMSDQFFVDLIAAVRIVLDRVTDLAPLADR